MFRSASALIVCAFFFVLPSTASADSVIEELRGGVLAQSCCAFGSNKESGVGVNGEVIFKSPKFLSVLGNPRPVVGGTAASDRDSTSQLYAGFDWEVDLTKRFFISGFLGGAIHNGETDDYDPVADAARVDDTLFYGCRLAFRLATDVGYRVTERVSVSFHWAHISNADLCGENEGLDHMGGRIAYKF